MTKLPLNLHSYEHGGVAAPSKKLFAPAMLLLPLLRYPLGYEIVHPWPMAKRVTVVFIFPFVFWALWGLGAGIDPPENEGRQYLYLFAAAMFVITLLRFFRRAWGQHRAEEIHTSEAGHSVVTRWLPLPASLGEQVVVPSALVWLGWQLAHSISVDLGWWLMLSAVSYFLLANWERRNQLAQRRAPVDDKIRAQGFVEEIDQHEERVLRKARRKEKHHATQAEQHDIAELGSGRRK